MHKKYRWLFLIIISLIFLLGVFVLVKVQAIPPPPCTDECPLAGMGECISMYSLRICGYWDADLCLEWGDDLSCRGSSSCGGYDGGCNYNERAYWYCSGGGCVTSCNYDPTCVTGSCTSNADCPASTNPCIGVACLGGVCTGGPLTGTPCPGGVCLNGDCVPSCTNQCSPEGATQCAGPNAFSICGNYDADICLEWNPTPVTCPGGGSCVNGTCTTCTNDCSPAGATQCASPSATSTCGNYDTDSCLEWGNTQSCAGSTACDYGACSPSERPVWSCSGGICIFDCAFDPSCGVCTNDCSPSGATQCAGSNSTSTCGNYDADSCLEWGTPLTCPGGALCVNGTCATCTNDCSPAGATICVGPNAVSSCADFDGDGCREWGDPLACPRGGLCVNGTCTTCTNDCSPAGATQCSGNSEQTCGNYDADSCLEWSTLQSCIGDTSCGYGSCSGTQRPSWLCQDGGCTYNCVIDSSCASCTNECSPGATQCSSLATYQTCGNYDADPCSEWSGSEICVGETSCGYGSCLDDQIPVWNCQGSGCSYSCSYDFSCATACQDDCSPSGKKQCSGDYSQTCGNYDADSCLEWSTLQSCTGDSSCGSSGCLFNQRPSWYCSSSTGGCSFDCINDSSCIPLPDCQDQCYSWGDVQCFDNTKKQTCGEYDSDACMEWSSPQVCTGDTTCGYQTCNDNQMPSWYCGDGSCSYTCVRDSTCGDICDDDCSPINKTQCFDSKREQVCGNYDADSCLDWSNPRVCGQGTQCGHETCTDNQRPVWYCSGSGCKYDCVDDTTCCVDDCSLGQTQCSGNNEKICGYYDSDSCLDWSSPRVCEGSTVCGYSTCTNNQRPIWYCSQSGCSYNCINDTTCGSLIDCTDDCSLGSSQCSGSSEQTCGYYDNDTCLEWSSPRVCEGDTSCSYGTCTDNQRPSWSCSGGACTYNCVTDTSCSVSICTNECPERWQTRCTDNTKEQTCGIYYDTDLCLEWYPPETCTGDTTCGYDTCNDDERPYWYCDNDKCNYSCTQDPTCTPEGYVKEYKQECYDNDLYWFDSNNEIQDKIKDCEDNDSSTRDGCENSQCFNRTQEDDYCFSQDHCPDNICNCDEDVYTCFEDCEFTNLTVNVSAKEPSDKDWKESISLSPKDEIDILITVLNDSEEDFDNVIIKAQLPQEVVYREGLRIDNVSSEGDIAGGINIGFLSSNAQKSITFKTQVSPEALIGTEAEIIGRAEVEDVFGSDSASITIEKGKVSILKWLISRWYIWLLLWAFLILLLFFFLKRRKEEILIFRVIGMDSARAAGTVKKAVRSLNGIKEMETDFENKRIQISFNPEKVYQEQIEKAILDVGYKAILEIPENEEVIRIEEAAFKKTDNSLKRSKIDKKENL